MICTELPLKRDLLMKKEAGHTAASLNDPLLYMISIHPTHLGDGPYASSRW